jgi:hypothetical protein
MCLLLCRSTALKTAFETNRLVVVSENHGSRSMILVCQPTKQCPVEEGAFTSCATGAQDHESSTRRKVQMILEEYSPGVKSWAVLALDSTRLYIVFIMVGPEAIKIASTNKLQAERRDP